MLYIHRGVSQFFLTLHYTELCIVSLKDTLAEATALLTEFEAQDQSDMEIGAQTTKSEETAGSSHSSSPVFFTTHSPAEHTEDFDTVDKDVG